MGRTHAPRRNPRQAELLHLIDILVDGRYLRDQKDSLLQFRGSRNQRILDVPKFWKPANRSSGPSSTIKNEISPKSI